MMENVVFKDFTVKTARNCQNDECAAKGVKTSLRLRHETTRSLQEFPVVEKRGYILLTLTPLKSILIITFNY